MKASIIICYTNKALISKTIEYLDSQDVRKDFEIIAIDNSENKFSSAAKALNYGASIAKGEILIFMHQDVFFEHSNDVSNLIGYFDKLDDLALLGVAGINGKDLMVYSNITETYDHINKYKNITEPIEVETIDECVIAIRKKFFDRIKFDEITCDNWHFYGVDLSYQVRLNNGKVYSVPVPVCHLSQGNTNLSFYKNLKKLGKKYHNVLPNINSTCIQTKNNRLILNYYVFRTWCGHLLRKIGLRK